MLLFLTGMPGSGKSFWMNALGRALSLKGTDLDATIEKCFDSTIAGLFRQGEAFFREKESEVLKSIILRYKAANENHIISTGGGAPCFNDNLKLMKNSGVVIYLKSTVDKLSGRILNDGTERPLLAQNAELKERLMELEKQRKSYYEQADLIVDADKLTLPIFVQQIEPFLKH